MRYLDTAGRNPDQTLGAWLKTLDKDVSSLRVQSGFFSSTSLPFLSATIDRLTSNDGTVSILVGSNDGTTSVAHVKALLEAVGPSRAGLSLGVVRFADGQFFHPKSVHVFREDDSATAYVGSANMTGKGVALHVEAGLVLDSRDGDPLEVLQDIAKSTDDWFAEGRPELFLLDESIDLDSLVDKRIIGVPRATRSAGIPTSHRVPLKTILPMLTAPASPAVEVLTWSKILDPSNAQRKPSGNNRGAITLGIRGYAIPYTWFRDTLFGDLDWVEGEANTGEPRDSVVVPMHVTIDGDDLGIVEMQVTDSPNRRQGDRHNVTTFLHVGALKAEFEATNLTDKELTLSRMSDGSFVLNIAPPVETTD